MQKELIITSSPQETKAAILEDDELVEFHIERHRSRNIAGNIYKGKVTKVLPGMQSAFVNIGLERDAFLYVSDFFEDAEEYEKIVSSVEEEAAQFQEKSGTVQVDRHPEPSAAPSTSAAPATTAALGETSRPVAPPISGETYERRGPRRKERDKRQKKPKIPSFESKREPEYEHKYGGIEVLPGESLAKYSNIGPKKIEKSAEFTEDGEGEPETPQGQGSPDSANPESAAVSPSEAQADAVAPSEEAAFGFPSDSADVLPPVEAQTVIETQKSGSEEQENRNSPDKTEPPAPAARVSERRDNYRFTRRPSGRRQRSRVPPPGRPEEHHANGSTAKGSPTISDLLREGQEILVQVAKEPLGNKGARITSHIALPGRYLVYMPTVDHIGVSRKIASEEERARLKRIIYENRNGLPGGFIVRTAAEGRDEREFIQDLRFLASLWADIRTKTEGKSAPVLIHRDLTLVQRILRDQLSEDFKAVRLDNEMEYATVVDFVNKFQPSLVSRVKLHLKDVPILEEYGLQAEIDRALRPKIWLKSGGYIVINQTEALVAIDVNTGKFVGKSNRLEDTITRTNLDAVHEIVRQLRLRNLGGIIVVDFIDMEEKKNRQRVMAALDEELRKDRSPSKSLQFNDFGLVAITRKRTQPSLERTLCTSCTHCHGSGWVKSAETLCYEIQQEIKKMAPALEGREITVRMSPEVAKALKSGEFVSISDLEAYTKKDIIVKSDPVLHEEHFDVY